MPFTNLFGLMGIATAPNGDIWVADGSDDQLLLFPGERLKDGNVWIENQVPATRQSARHPGSQCNRVGPKSAIERPDTRSQ